MRTQNYRRARWKFYLGWIIVYALLVGVAAAFGAATYHEYKERHLPPGHIELKVSKTRYQLGEVVEFTVINHFPVPIFVTNHCPEEPLSVYKWEHEQWTQLHATAKDDGECYKEDRNVEIPSEGSRTYNFADWPSLFSEPGVYRIATAVDHYSGTPFQDFVVLEPAQIIDVPEESVPAVPPEAAATPSEPAVDVIREEEGSSSHDIFEHEEGEHEYEDD